MGSWISNDGIKKLSSNDLSHKLASGWTNRTYCPCGHNHRNWMRIHNISEKDIGGGICKGQQFNDFNQFSQHMLSKGEKCLIHLGLCYYLNLLYPEFFKITKKQQESHSLLLKED